MPGPMRSPAGHRAQIFARAKAWNLRPCEGLERAGNPRSRRPWNEKKAALPGGLKREFREQFKRANQETRASSGRTGQDHRMAWMG